MELRDKTIEWYIAALLTALLILLFGTIIANNARTMGELRDTEAYLRTQISQANARERSLRLQVSNGGTISGARAMSFVLPNEVCFEVLDADLLDLYTEDEWKIIQEERNLGLR